MPKCFFVRRGGFAKNFFLHFTYYFYVPERNKKQVENGPL